MQGVCEKVPEAIAAVLCDQQGETIVSALGMADVPPRADELAKDHVPSRMGLNMPVSEFLVRLAGAEPCALIRQLQGAQNEVGAGEIDAYVARYDLVDIIVEQLPEDLYLFVALRRPASVGLARRFTRAAARELQTFLD